MKLACAILAAGRGTRMKSRLPKVLHKLCGIPMLDYVLDAAQASGAKTIAVVAGHKLEALKKHIGGRAVVVRQKNLLGTADAVLSARQEIRGSENVLVLCADAPLVKPATIRKLVKAHEKSSGSATVLTAEVSNPYGYGRIVRGASGEIIRIVEELDAASSEKQIREINAGAYCFKTKELFGVLKEVRPNNRKKEYYLTDAIEVFLKRGRKIASFLTPDADEALGINTHADLAKANAVLYARKLKELMESGVTVIDTTAAFISPRVKIGAESVVYPFTFIENDVTIGKCCSIGPFCRIRPGTSIEDGAAVGNFVELNRTKIKRSARVKHQSYLGDAVVGANANVAAGTITANWDGKRKNQTEIGDGAMLGCGTILVAPVKVGRRAVTGAGAVVTKGKDVPAGETVVGIPAHILRKGS